MFEDLEYPDLVKIKEDSYQKAREVREFNDKLRGYRLRLDISVLNKWIEHFLELNVPEAAMEKLLKIQQKLISLSENPKFQLNPEDAKAIEEETKTKMTELVTEQMKGSFLKLSSSSLFWKCRSIIQETKDSKEEKLEAEKNVIEEDEKLHSERKKCDEGFRNLTSEDYLLISELREKKRYLLHVDIIDKSLKLDAAFIRLFLASKRGLLCQIMRTQWFPDGPDDCCHKKIYSCFISEVETKTFEISDLTKI